MRFPDLAQGLAAIPTDSLDAPPTARRGAVLVLLEDAGDGRARILYTRRQAHLSSHPGQISFPGGRVDADETVVDAALREAHEEVRLDPPSVTVLGRLPAFYIPPSRFWMSAVVATWDRPHPLVAAEDEVAEILHVDTALLAEEARWRSVPLSAAGRTWAWVLEDSSLLWGATAVMTGIVLDMLVPGWNGGTRPDDLPDDRVVRPWEDPAAAGLATPTRPPRARLRDVSPLDVDRPVGWTPSPDPPTEAQLTRWARGVADAVLRLHRQGDGPTVVLCGPGTTGRVGSMAAAMLAEDGRTVTEVAAVDGVLEEVLAEAGVIVDAMLGRGLRGVLADPLLEVVRSLRSVSAPIVAVDLPTGIDPHEGVVGESVSADVTVTDPTLVPGHLAGGAMPFVADLYVVDATQGLRRAAVRDRAADWAE